MDWLAGIAGSGKTEALIQHLLQWVQTPDSIATVGLDQAATPLVFAATGDNRLALQQRLDSALAAIGRAATVVHTTTPLGFFEAEVLLFWPLLVEKLCLPGNLALRLRPETEQALATERWQPYLAASELDFPGQTDYFKVRRSLDILFLAASSGLAIADINLFLQERWGLDAPPPTTWEVMGQALQQWYDWCLQRGFLTYGILTELYVQHLLPDAIYQQHLQRRHCACFADDLDEYPAAMGELLAQFQQWQLPGALTYNAQAGVRRGYGADPEAIATLAHTCEVTELAEPQDRLGQQYASVILPCLSGQAAGDPFSEVAFSFSTAQEVKRTVGRSTAEPVLPLQIIQTTTRATLLRQVATVIQTAMQAGQIQPQEIAIIGPGLDAIARYTLSEILRHQQIQIQPLAEQRALHANPVVRALLTLMTLVYPGMGRLVDRDQVAEMLVVLTAGVSVTDAEQSSSGRRPEAGIDPVRAGLLVDHCFVPDLEQPHLLEAKALPRWDRLGYSVTDVYTKLQCWLNQQRQQQQQGQIEQPISVLDRAIQTFLWRHNQLTFEQLNAIRALLETAQHYWQVQQRSAPQASDRETVKCFVELLREGTITADPYPVGATPHHNQAITLATAFQYRLSRQCHRWQFWLDFGSGRWLTGNTGLFAAPAFLQQSSPYWTLEAELQLQQAHLETSVLDLLNRATERVYWCWSELGTSGNDQTGPLLSLLPLGVNQE
ncbi:MAG: recombinase family protein [Cyanobacteria bacterium P01_H01_bin.121]